MDGQLHVDRPQIAILDFGSQYSHLIARRVREINVFCELYSCLVKGEVLRKNQVVGIILSGGPNSVYEKDSPHVDADVWAYIEEQSIPVMGICYGLQVGREGGREGGRVEGERRKAASREGGREGGRDEGSRGTW
ncbi:gmp synthase [Nannochloropsis oceanica]